MRTLSVLTCLAAGLTPATTFAQTQSDEVFLGTILLSSPSVPGLGEDQISVTSEGIALSNPADLSELFVAEPTIAIGSSIPMSQKVYVNGIEENNLAISIDGARQNNKIFHHNTTTLIDPALLKTIRIDPGVAPADAGPGALGGALAYESKDVGDFLVEGDPFGGNYKVEYDTNGDILANAVTVYGTQNRIEYLGFFKYATGDVRSDGDGTDINGSGTNLISGLAKLAYETDNGGRFELSFEKVRDDADRPYRSNIDTIVGQTQPLTRPYDLSRTNVVFNYSQTTPTGMWDPTIRLAYSGTELFNDETALATAQTIFGETKSINGEFSNRFEMGWGSINAGVDFFSDTAGIDYVSLTNAANNYATSEKLRNIGVFAQVRMEPTDRSRLSFGLRGDNQQFTGTDGTTQTDTGLSGNISGELTLLENLTLSAGYSHVWAGAELAENYILSPVWTYPAGGIEPVTADSVYVAASYEVGNWVFDGKLFGTTIDNARAASYGGGPELTTDLETRGFELGIGTGWSGGFFRVGFASIDAELNGRTADSYTGNYLTMPMGEFLTLQTAHRFDNGLLIGGDAQMTFGYADTYDFGTGGQGPSLPGYTVVNAFVEYSPPRMENLTLRAEINNLLNETYASRATYGQEFVGAVEPLKEPGRSIRLSAVLDF